MTQHDAESWRKAVGKRQDLAEKYAGDPTVALVDIGSPPRKTANTQTRLWFAST